MKDRAQVVWYHVLCGARPEHLGVERVAPSCIVGVDADELVPVRPLVFMPETNGMANLMNYDANL